MSRNAGSLVGLRRPWCGGYAVSSQGVRVNTDGHEVATCPGCRREIRVRPPAEDDWLWSFYRHYRYVPEDWR